MYHPYFELFYFCHGKAVWSLKLSKSFTTDDEHCICVRNIQLNNFISIHCQQKCIIPILNCFNFVMERQCGLRSYLRVLLLMMNTVYVFEISS